MARDALDATSFGQYIRRTVERASKSARNKLRAAQRRDDAAEAKDRIYEAGVRRGYAAGRSKKPR